MPRERGPVKKLFRGILLWVEVPNGRENDVAPAFEASDANIRVCEVQAPGRVLVEYRAHNALPHSAEGNITRALRKVDVPCRVEVIPNSATYYPEECPDDPTCAADAWGLAQIEAGHATPKTLPSEIELRRLVVDAVGPVTTPDGRVLLYLLQEGYIDRAIIGITSDVETPKGLKQRIYAANGKRGLPPLRNRALFIATEADEKYLKGKYGNGQRREVLPIYPDQVVHELLYRGAELLILVDHFDPDEVLG